MFKIFKIQSADYLCSSFIVASKFTKAHLHLLMLVSFHIFFDIFQFLTPGCNLESFFKAFGLSEQKGYFPYEYFTDTNQLDVKKLSPYEAFYSTMKYCNLHEEEYASFQKLLDQGKQSKKPFRFFL